LAEAWFSEIGLPLPNALGNWNYLVAVSRRMRHTSEPELRRITVAGPQGQERSPSGGGSVAMVGFLSGRG